MMNVDCNEHQAREDFSRQGRCRIDHFLDSDAAERLYEVLSKHTQFDVAYACSPSPKLVSAESWRAMDAPARNSLQQQLIARAAEGEGFLYCTYLAHNRATAASKESDFLDEVFAFWGGESMQAFVRSVTHLEIDGAESQFTRYTTGQYLTRHRDTLAGNRRRLAFVLSLSKDWHPDWGGLLHFYDQGGEIRETWIPRFNTLQLFDISQIHGVSMVAPCAPRGRYSLTGWFLAEEA